MLRPRRITSGATTLSYDYGLLVMIRRYLGYKKSHVARETELSDNTILNIEKGSLPVPDILIKFYAEVLDIKLSNLQFMLTSNKKRPSTRIVNKILSQYLKLILRLRAYEAEEKI